MEMNKISVVVSGANRVEIVKNLRAFADNLDGSPAALDGKPATSAKTTKTAAPAKKAAAPPADDDDGFVTDDGSAEPAGFDDDAAAEEVTEEESFEEEPKKAAPKKGANGKAKKLTLDDVNDACKAHAAAKGRPSTLEILKKKFKTQSVTALKPEQYEACISAMSVN